MDVIINLRVPYPSETDTERLLTDSQVFGKMRYELRNGQLIIYTPKNGVLSVPLRWLTDWAYELVELAEAWEGVRT